MVAIRPAMFVAPVTDSSRSRPSSVLTAVTSVSLVVVFSMVTVQVVSPPRVIEAGSQVWSIGTAPSRR
ncbi:hypothetical protein D3C83_87430 [compost metagenome]